MNVEKKRFDYIDAAKFITMYLVIVGHMVYPFESNIFRFVFAFHMPAFFFFSGYTYNFRKEEQLPHYLLRKAKNYLLPYVMLSVIGFAAAALMHKLPTGYTFHIYAMLFFYYTEPVAAAGGVWFLAALFFSSAMMFCVMKIWENRSLAELCLFTVILMYIAGVFMPEIVVNRYMYLPFRTTTNVMALVFMLLGFFARKTNVLHKIGKRVYMLLAVILPCIVYKLGVLNGYVNICEGEFGNPAFYYTAALCGILLVLILGMALKRFKPILWLGKNTLPVFGFHGYFVSVSVSLYCRLVGIENNGFIPDNIWVPVLSVFVYMACIPLIFIWNFAAKIFNEKILLNMKRIIDNVNQKQRLT